jgi:hypothetical protein
MAWGNYMAEIEGRPGSVLLDDRFAASALLAELTCVDWFGVRFRMNPGGASWHPDETARLNAIADDLLRLCRRHGHARSG